MSINIRTLNADEQLEYMMNATGISQEDGAVLLSVIDAFYDLKGVISLKWPVIVNDGEACIMPDASVYDDLEIQEDEMAQFVSKYMCIPQEFAEECIEAAWEYEEVVTGISWEDCKNE